jgi:CRISPR-associated endonuclease/helicase Cas3
MLKKMPNIYNKGEQKKAYLDNAWVHVMAGQGKWLEHLLEDYLVAVAKLAKDLADIGDRPILDMSGRCYHLGKYPGQWQKYVKSNSAFNPAAHIEEKARVNHSTAGAIHAVNALGDGQGHAIAYLIAGHHAGLTHWNTADFGRGGLKHRLSTSMPEYMDTLAATPPAFILKKSEISLAKVAHSPKSIALWTRMLFSCLVDSDFLYTESFMDEDKAAQRVSWPGVDELPVRFDQKIKALKGKADVTPLNTVRNEIFQSCLDAAPLSPGLFSLSVPTGGRQTLSSLAFALEHAKRHNKSRVIYAIPCTCIIEQNADVFRQFVGHEAVLEHYSNLDVPPVAASFTISEIALSYWMKHNNYRGIYRGSYRGIYRGISMPPLPKSCNNSAMTLLLRGCYEQHKLICHIKKPFSVKHGWVVCRMYGRWLPCLLAWPNN